MGTVTYLSKSENQHDENNNFYSNCLNNKRNLLGVNLELSAIMRIIFSQSLYELCYNL